MVKYCPICRSTMRHNGKFMSCPNWRSHQGKKAPAQKAGASRRPEPVIERPNYLAFKLTDQQDAYANAVLEALAQPASLKRGRVIAIEGVARAGTGKTTTAMVTMARALARNPKLRIAYGAYNRRNANEAIAKAPVGIECNTIHSLLGKTAIQRAYPGSRIDPDKPWRIVRKLLPRGVDDADEFTLRDLRKVIVRTYELAMEGLVDARDEQAVMDLADYYGLEFREYGITLYLETVKALVAESLATVSEAMSFADMVAAPVMLAAVAAKIPRIGLLVVDEAQDLSAGQQACALMAIGFVPPDIQKRFGIPPAKGPMGILSYIGDERQAIYAFRGAPREGLDNFYDLVQTSGQDILTCHITRTRRCPRRVVELMRVIVPDFEAELDAPEGAVYLVNDQHVIDHIGQGRQADDTLILSRTNAALVPLALVLVRMEPPIPVQFVSSDLGERLARIARGFSWGFKENGGGEASLDHFITDLHNRMSKLVEGSRGKALKERAVNQYDMYDLLVSIATASDDWHAFFENIAKLFNSVAFDPDSHPVRFSTIHGIKGGESKYVILLGGDKMPHPMAEQEWEIEQELNMLYVAGTRAMEQLWFCNTVPPILSDNPIIEMMPEGDNDG